MSVTNGITCSSMIEFSGSHHKVPHLSLSSFLDLSEIDTLCYVNKCFKLCFTKTGNFLACRLHKLALSVFLSIQKIDPITRRSGPHDHPCWVDKCHDDVLKKFSDQNKVHVSPLRLYKYLIKSTNYQPFYDHFSRTVRIELLSILHLETSKIDINWHTQTFFSLYSQLKQAKVYMPQILALVINHLQQNRDVSYTALDKSCLKICEELVKEWWHNSSKEELLEPISLVIEQIFDPEIRGRCQSWLKVIGHGVQEFLVV